MAEQKKQPCLPNHMDLENENVPGKIFRWKKNHPNTVYPIKLVMKVSKKTKEEDAKLGEKYFLTYFTQCKEGEHHIDQSKAPEYMDT